MKIYHGSTVVVSSPEIRKSETNLDFGVGFYMTTSYEQAKRWARVKMRREEKDVGYISVYEFDEEKAFNDLKVKKFLAADMDWLMFVVDNRNGVISTNFVDMTIGPVADDNVYKTIRFFETGVIDADETIKRLKTEILQDQWVAHSDSMLSYIKFVQADKVEKEKQNGWKTIFGNDAYNK